VLAESSKLKVANSALTTFQLSTFNLQPTTYNQERVMMASSNAAVSAAVASTERFYRAVFLIGALWNVAGGIFIVVFTRWIFKISGLTPPDPPNYYQSWIALFIAFGIGYYLAYLNMYLNRNIILLGMIGKVAFAAIFLIEMLIYRGQIPAFFLVPAIGDLVFAVIFARFLVFTKKRGKQTSLRGIEN
jgi:hypothetical protein